MIEIRVNPGRVEEIALTGLTIIERQIEAAVLRAIQPLIDQLDAELRSLTEQIVAEYRADNEAAGIKVRTDV